MTFEEWYQAQKWPISVPDETTKLIALQTWNSLRQNYQAEALILNLIDTTLTNLSLKDKMVSQLVKKKKMGAYQAHKECVVFEKEIKEAIHFFLKGWLASNIIEDSFLKKKILIEIDVCLNTELARKGFDHL